MAPPEPSDMTPEKARAELLEMGYGPDTPPPSTEPWMRATWALLHAPPAGARHLTAEVERRMNAAWEVGDSYAGDALHDLWMWLGGPEQTPKEQ